MKLIRAKYTTIASAVQLSIIGTDSSGKQCAGIYPAQLVGGRRPPNSRCIGAAPPDAQAAGGVCWPVHTGQGGDARRAAPRRAHLPTTRLRVVGKCALREGRQRERSAQVIPRRSRFGPLLLVNHRPSSLRHFATNEPQSM